MWADLASRIRAVGAVWSAAIGTAGEHPLSLVQLDCACRALVWCLVGPWPGTGGVTPVLEREVQRLIDRLYPGRPVGPLGEAASQAAASRHLLRKTMVAFAACPAAGGRPKRDCLVSLYDHGAVVEASRMSAGGARLEHASSRDPLVTPHSSRTESPAPEPSVRGRSRRRHGRARSLVSRYVKALAKPCPPRPGLETVVSGSGLIWAVPGAATHHFRRASQLLQGLGLDVDSCRPQELVDLLSSLSASGELHRAERAARHEALLDPAFHTLRLGSSLLCCRQRRALTHASIHSETTQMHGAQSITDWQTRPAPARL